MRRSAVRGPADTIGGVPIPPAPPEPSTSDHCRFGATKPHRIDIAPDQAIAKLADRQHGVVGRSQLIEIGVTASMIRTRRERGRLIVVHKGVYAVGHRRLTSHGFWLAAVLAGGDGAVLSHRDAATLHRVLSSDRSRIEVTTPRTVASTSRIDVYARRTLQPEELATIAGIPVTTVERTLVDLAGVVPPHRLRKALAEAERMRVADARALAAAMERTRSRAGRGHAALTTALKELRAHGPQKTRSTAEDLLLDLAIEHRLARPSMNRIVDGVEVDALWPAQRVAVEVDGDAYHWTPSTRARDRAKANGLVTAGWRVLRFGWLDVSDPLRRPSVVAALRAAGIPDE